MLRPGVCARCRSTWVPHSEAGSDPVYCPLCRLQTAPRKRFVLNRPLSQRFLYCPAVAGTPLLLLALLFGAVVARTLLAQRSATNQAPAAAYASTAASTLSPIIESPGSTSPSAVQPREMFDIEIIGPPHELTVLLAPPPQIPVEEGTVAVANQAPTQPAQPEAVVAIREAPKLCEKPAGMFGTSILFAANPTEAKKQAGTQEKLVFLLHVSGDFDDPGFT